MSMSGKTTSTTTPDAAVTSRATTNYDENKAWADQGTEAYTGQRVAQLNSSDQDYFSALRNVANGTQGEGLSTEAAGIASDLGSYNAQTVKAGLLKDQDLSAYQDPYTGQVIDATAADLARGLKQANASSAVSSAKSGNTGGTGAAALLLGNSDAFARSLASTSAQLRSEGYQNAQDAATGDLDRTLSADTSNQSADISSANVRQNAAGLLGDLGQSEFDRSVTRAGLLGEIGTTEREVEQAGYDAQYEEFLRQYEDEFKRKDVVNQSLSAIPTGSSTTQKTTPGLLDYLKVGAQAATAATASDGRLKEDIETLRIDEAGRRWVFYRYKWDKPGTRREGVIAQEIELIEPWRVSVMPSGFKAVDYAGLI